MSRARTGDGPGLGELQGLVDRLIKENRELKRRVAAAEASRPAIDLRPLSGIKRRLESALSERPASGARSWSARPRRPASPETMAKRRQALARARAARTVKSQSKLIKVEETTGSGLTK